MKIKTIISGLLISTAIIAMEKVEENSLEKLNQLRSLKLLTATAIANNQIKVSQDKVPIEILEFVNCIKSAFSLNLSSKSKEFLINFIDNPEMDIDNYFFSLYSKQNTLDEILLASASKELLTFVKLMLKLGADINAQDKNKNTALIYAAISGNIEIVKLLINSGANTRVKNIQGNTALMYALEGKNKDIAQLLFTRVPEFKDPELESEELGRAMYNNDKQLLKNLINNGANINTISTLRFFPWHTPLTMAICFANINEGKSIDILNIVLNAGADIDFCLEIAAGNNQNLVKFFLEKGANPNTQSRRLHCLGDTALMLVIKWNCSRNILKVLLRSGADPNIKNQYGNTALILAVKFNSDFKKSNIFKMLLEAGADPNIKNIYGESALSLAKKHKGHIPGFDYFYWKHIIKIMKQYDKFNQNTKSNDKKCALM